MTPTLNKMRYTLSIVDGDTQAVVASNVRCSLEDLIGRRLETAQALAANTTHKFVIRGNSLMNSTRNVVCNGQTYQVTYVLDPGRPYRGVYLEVFATRIKDGI
jgi:SPP1 family predicted phage head-tail adaptor